MSCEVVYSPEALDDLDRIWSEVWDVSCDFDTADRYVDDLKAEVGKKKKYPKTGIPLTSMGEFTGIYMIPFKAYTAFYRINQERIEAGRILYSKSDYMKTLFGRSEFLLEENESQWT